MAKQLEVPGVTGAELFIFQLFFIMILEKQAGLKSRFPQVNRLILRSLLCFSSLSTYFLTSFYSTMV